MLPSDSHFSFQWPPVWGHTVLPSSVFFITELLLLDKDWCSTEKPGQDQVAQIVSLSDSLAPGSWLKPITVSACVEVCCVIWFGSFYTILLSSQYDTCPLICWLCTGSSLSCGEAQVLLRPLGHTGLPYLSFPMASHGEEGTAQELGEWNTYLKEKGLGRTSLRTLHSTSLCDY